MHCKMKYCIYYSSKNQCTKANIAIDKNGICNRCTIKPTKSSWVGAVAALERRKAGLVAIAAALEFLEKEE